MLTLPPVIRVTVGEGSTIVVSPPSPVLPDQTNPLRIPDHNTGSLTSGVAPNPQVPDPADDIFREALENHKLSLSPEQRQAFLGVSAIGLIDMIKQLDQQHADGSGTRLSIMRVQGFLQVVNGYLNSLVILIQHSPEYSSLVVRGLRYFLDVSCAFC